MKIIEQTNTEKLPLKNLNKQQLAAHLCVSVRFIEKMMRGHKIPYRKLSRRCVRFNLAAVEKSLSRFDVRAIGEEDGRV